MRVLGPARVCFESAKRNGIYVIGDKLIKERSDDS